MFFQPTGRGETNYCTIRIQFDIPTVIMLSYIEARKKIYCPEYARLVQKTQAFAQLRALHQSGVNLLITDVDVPETGIDFTPENYRSYLNNPTPSFGHG